MITSNDLFDLYFSFVLIRDNVAYPLNTQILKTISATVLSRCNADNNIRKSLSQIETINSEKWNFVFFENVYTYRKLITDKKSIHIISKICLWLCKLIEEKQIEQAYDFVDSIHFVPLLIEKNMRISFKRVRKLTKKYQQKWRSKFVNYLKDF